MRIISFLFFCLFSIQLANAQNAPTHDIGDWWVFKDPRTGQLETAIVEKIAKNGDFTVVNEKGDFYATYTAELNQKQRVNFYFSPHTSYLPSFPLTTGKT